MSATPPTSGELHDDQQLRLVQRLRAAGGAPLDFEELRAMGIEHPAVVCYELEIAGVPIFQTRRSDRRMLQLDLRADELQQEAGEPVTKPQPAAAATAPRARIGAAARALGTGFVAMASRSRAQHRPRPAHSRSGAQALRAAVARLPDPSVAVSRARARLDPPVRRLAAFAGTLGARRAMVGAWLALGAVLVAVLAIVLGAQAGAGRPAKRAQTARPAATRPSPGRPGLRAQAPPQPGSSGASPTSPRSPLAEPTAGAPRPGRISPAAAASLEREGHQLLLEGRYPAAIGDLLGALRAGGQSLGRCTEPTTEACLTYAYALYDLGRALRLNGEAAAAVPVLSRRLRIDNQREVVQRELDLARGGST